ncbi:hypothetical protein ACEPAG_3850 [Sanghuangporus baumii]
MVPVLTLSISDILFIQDTQKTLNDHLSVSLKAIESVIAHAPLLPRYRPGGVRFGLVTFCDDGREPTQDKPEITTYKLTDNHNQFLHSLRSLKAKQVAPVSDGANHALHLALEAFPGANWNASADKIIILSVYKRSRPLDPLAIETLRRLSRENVHLLVTRDMHILDLFDEEPNQALIKDIERLNLVVPLYISAFIYAALRAHSDRYQKKNEHKESIKSLATFFLWDWGCEGEKCSILDTRKPEPLLLGTKRLSLENDRMAGSVLFSEPGSEIQKGHVSSESAISRFPSIGYDIEKSPTATLVNLMSPRFSSATRTDSREDSSSEDAVSHIDLVSFSTDFRASDLEQGINECPVNQVGLNSPVAKGSSVPEESSDRKEIRHQSQKNGLGNYKSIDKEKPDSEAVVHKGAANQSSDASDPLRCGDSAATNPNSGIRATASGATIVTQSQIEPLLKCNTRKEDVLQNPSNLARENEAPNGEIPSRNEHVPTQDSDDVEGYHIPQSDTFSTQRIRIESHPTSKSSDKLGGEMLTEAISHSPSTFVSPELTELPALEQNRESNNISRDAKQKKSVTNTEQAAKPGSDSAGAEKKHDHMTDTVSVGPAADLASQSQRPVSHASRDTEKPALIAPKSREDAAPEHDKSIPSRTQSAQQVPDSSKTPSVSQTRHYVGVSLDSKQTLSNSINAKKQPISSGQRLAYADVLRSARSVDLRKSAGQKDDRGRHLDGSARELDSNRQTKLSLLSSHAHPPYTDTHDKQDSKLHQRSEEVVIKADANNIPILCNTKSENSSFHFARNQKDLTHDSVAAPTANSVNPPDLRSDETSSEVNSVPLICSDRKRQDIENDATSPTKKQKDSDSSIGHAVAYSLAAEDGLQDNATSECAVGLDQNNLNPNVCMKADVPGLGVGIRDRQSEEKGKNSGTSESYSERLTSEKVYTVVVQKEGSGAPHRGKDISSEDQLFQPTGRRRPVSEDSSPSKLLGTPKVSTHQASASHKPIEASPAALTLIGDPFISEDSAKLSSPLVSQKMHEAENAIGEKPVAQAQESESSKSIENQTLKETKLRTTVNSSQVKNLAASNRRSATLSEASLKSDFKTSARSEQRVEYAETYSRSPAPGINDTDGETTAKSKVVNRSIEDSHTQAGPQMVPQVTKRQHTDRAAEIPIASSELKPQQNLVTSNSGGNIIRYDASSISSSISAQDCRTMAEGQRSAQGAEEKVSSHHRGSTTTSALERPEIATRELRENHTPPESNGPLDRTALAVNRAELPWSQQSRSDVSSALSHDRTPDSKDRKASVAEEGESVSSGSSRLASQKNDANLEGIHPSNAIVMDNEVSRPRKEILQSAHPEGQCVNASSMVLATGARSRTGRLGSKLCSPDSPTQKRLEIRQSSSEIGLGESSGRTRGQPSSSVYPNEDIPLSTNNRSSTLIPKSRDSQQQMPSQSSASTPKRAGTETTDVPVGKVLTPRIRPSLSEDQNKMTSSSIVKEQQNADTSRENSCYSIELDCNSAPYQASVSTGESRLVNKGVEGAANDTLTNIAAPAILLKTSQLAVPSCEHQTSQGVNAAAVQQPMDTASSPQVTKREEATGVPTTCSKLESPRSPATPFRKKDSSICNDGNTARPTSPAPAPKGRVISDTEPTSRPTEEKAFPSGVGNNLVNSSVNALTSIKVASNESGESSALSPSRLSASKALTEENQPSIRSSDLAIQESAACKGRKDIGNRNAQLPHSKKDILQSTHQNKQDEENLTTENVSPERTVASFGASDITVPKLCAGPRVAETKVTAQHCEPSLPGPESHTPNHLGLSPSILEEVRGKSGSEARSLSSPSSLADEDAGISVINRSPTSSLAPQCAKHLAPNWPSASMPKQFDDKVSTPHSIATKEVQIDDTGTETLKASTRLGGIDVAAPGISSILFCPHCRQLIFFPVADTISASVAHVSSRLENKGARTTTKSAQQVMAHQDTDRATNVPPVRSESMPFQGTAISLGGEDTTAPNDTYASSSPQKDSAISGDQLLTQVDNGEKTSKKTVVGLTAIVKQSSGDESSSGLNKPSSQILSPPRHRPSITAPRKSEKDSVTDSMKGKGRFEVATREAYPPKSRGLSIPTSQEAGANKECSQVLSTTAAESMLTWKGVLKTIRPKKQRENSASTIGVSSNTQVAQDIPGPGRSRVVAAKLDPLLPATESKVSSQQRGSELSSSDGPPSNRLGISPENSNVANGALGSEVRGLPSTSSRPSEGTGIPVNRRSPTSNLRHEGSQQLMPNRPLSLISAISINLGVSDQAITSVGREAVAPAQNKETDTSSSAKTRDGFPSVSSLVPDAKFVHSVTTSPEVRSRGAVEPINPKTTRNIQMESARGRTSELQQENAMNSARGKEHVAESTPEDSSAIQEGSGILQPQAANKVASQLTEDLRNKGKRAQMMVNEEMRKPVQMSKEPRVPFNPKIEVGEQTISKEQTRRIVLEALMTFTRFSAM